MPILFPILVAGRKLEMPKTTMHFKTVEITMQIWLVVIRVQQVILVLVPVMQIQVVKVAIIKLLATRQEAHLCHVGHVLHLQWRTARLMAPLRLVWEIRLHASWKFVSDVEKCNKFQWAVSRRWRARTTNGKTFTEIIRPGRSVAPKPTTFTRSVANAAPHRTVPKDGTQLQEMSGRIKSLTVAIFVNLSIIRQKLRAHTIISLWAFLGHFWFN